MKQIVARDVHGMEHCYFTPFSNLEKYALILRVVNVWQNYEKEPIRFIDTTDGFSLKISYQILKLKGPKSPCLMPSLL